MSGQDQRNPDELQVPFLFVPYGDPFPTEWVKEHPDYIRIPAVMLPRGTGCTSYEQACAWLQAREQEKAQREAQAEIDRAPVSGFGRSYAMGAPPMARRPGRMIRGGPPPKYPGGWGAPEGEMAVGPDPVGTYLRINAGMMAAAARYATGATAKSGEPRTSLDSQVASTANNFVQTITPNATAQTADPSGTNGFDADAITLVARSTPPPPLPEAQGRPHTIIQRPGPGGNYTTYDEYGPVLQYRGEAGRAHGPFSRPNVKIWTRNTNRKTGKVFPGDASVRDPLPDEVPGPRPIVPFLPEEIPFIEIP